jgi:riboflavin synthase
VRLRIGHSAELGSRLTIGASLAVAGVCLTIVEHEPGASEVELSRETLARTRLGRLRDGDGVNLEPSLRAGDPLGGHFVQGHVDGLARLRRRADAVEHSEFEVDVPDALARYVAEKGSVALDGVSLTVAAVLTRGFSVALIPHTLAVTTLGTARTGDLFHLEVDILAKYVDRAVASRLDRAAAENAAGPAFFGLPLFPKRP